MFSISNFSLEFDRGHVPSTDINVDGNNKQYTMNTKCCLRAAHLEEKSIISLTYYLELIIQITPYVWTRSGKPPNTALVFVKINKELKTF